jgi:hypothetical protein
MNKEQSVEIDNSKMYSKPVENCPKCGIKLNVRVVIHNKPENCKEHLTFPYMEIGQSMHLECYIEHVIDIYLKKITK